MAILGFIFFSKKSLRLTTMAALKRSVTGRFDRCWKRCVGELFKRTDHILCVDKTMREISHDHKNNYAQ
ncbi:unnamed protein product [Brassica oleracea var. botrytis]